MNKIAVLYICTGKYNQFFDGFYKSAMKYFMTNHEKTFFVWTDDDHIADGLPNVRVIHKESAGFPADSLFRFEMYLQAEEDLNLKSASNLNGNLNCSKELEHYASW